MAYNIECSNCKEKFEVSDYEAHKFCKAECLQCGFINDLNHLCANPVRDWYFTFGFGHKHEGCYTVIKGTYDEARMEMFDKHGLKWAFQYIDAEDAGVEKWQLKKI